MGSDKLVVSYTDVNGNEATQTYEDYEAAATFRDQKTGEGVEATMAVEKAPAFRFVHLAQLLTLYYFAYFLVILPLLGLRENPKDESVSIHKAVLGHDRAAPAPAE
jgi:ubiquinol-cytochrome c reductase cytochrome b subunit